MEFIKNLFRKKPSNKIICGGDVCCEIKDKSGNHLGCIWGRRPTSDERLEYVYKVQEGLATDENLKDLSGSKNKALRIHEIMMKDLAIPYAQKLFIRSEGFVVDEKPLESLDGNKQFEHIAKYYSHVLVAFVSILFEVDHQIKKKD